ncbi:MAG: hypothetical protein ACKO6N_04685 [Myxococcota bacterium]
MAEVKLYPYSYPPLLSGSYTLEVFHGLHKETVAFTPHSTPSESLQLKVEAPRLKLPGSEILASWPVPDAKDIHPDLLPYVVLKRETLPWERLPGLANNTQRVMNAPWMVLAVIPEAELLTDAESVTPAQHLYKAKVLRAQRLDTVYAPAELQAGAGSAAETCDVLDISLKHSHEILPSPLEASVLAHVREVPMSGTGSYGDDDGFVSLVLSARLGQENSKHRVMLLSYFGYDLVSAHALMLRGQRPQTDRFKLVILHEWTYETGSGGIGFESLITGLNLQPWGWGRTAPVGLSNGSDPLSSLNRFYKLQQRARDGKTGNAFYRGPLLSSLPEGQCYEPSVGIEQVPALTVTIAGETGPDINLSAAFELGRLLGLSDRVYLTELQQYRRAWQKALSKAALSDSVVAQQLQATAPPKKSTTSSATGLTKVLAPVAGLAELASAPVTLLAKANRLAASAQADGSGMKRLVGSAQVPGLNPTVLSAQKGVVTTPVKSTTGQTAGAETSTISSTLNTVTVEQQASPLKSADTGSQAFKSKSVATAPLTNGQVLFETDATMAKYSSVFEKPSVPTLLSERLLRLRKLERVPFTYLVPDPNLLPLESIRFFALDERWMQTLVQGALAAGASGELDKNASTDLVMAVQAELELRLYREYYGKPPKASGYGIVPPVFGLLLRSKLVRQYPNLVVAAEGEGRMLPIARQERLSDDLLLVLFLGLPKQVRLEQPSSGLEFGVERSSAGGSVGATSDPKGKVTAPTESYSVLWQHPLNTQQADVSLPVKFVAGNRRRIDFATGLLNELAKQQPNPDPAGYPSDLVAWALQQDPYVRVFEGFDVNSRATGTFNAGSGGPAGSSAVNASTSGGGKGSVKDVAILEAEKMPVKEMSSPQPVKVSSSSTLVMAPDMAGSISTSKIKK